MKLLHERIRELDEEANDGSTPTLEVGGFCIPMHEDEANALADEIEKWYVPKPRFRNSEPVSFGDEVVWSDCCNRIVTGFGVTAYGRSYVSCFGDERGMSDCMLYDDGELTRPKPMIVDADDVPIEVGDIVYGTENGTRFDVIDITDEGFLAVRAMEVYPRGSIVILQPKCLTHREPLADAFGNKLVKGAKVWPIDKPHGLFGFVSDIVNGKVNVRWGAGTIDTWSDPSDLLAVEPVFDADDMLIKPGDFVWTFDANSERCEVKAVHPSDTFEYYEGVDPVEDPVVEFYDGSWCVASEVTHREVPTKDGLKRLVSDIVSIESIEDRESKLDSVIKYIDEIR